MPRRCQLPESPSGLSRCPCQGPGSRPAATSDYRSWLGTRCQPRSPQLTTIVLEPSHPSCHGNATSPTAFTSFHCPTPLARASNSTAASAPGIAAFPGPHHYVCDCKQSLWPSICTPLALTPNVAFPGTYLVAPEVVLRNSTTPAASENPLECSPRTIKLLML